MRELSSASGFDVNAAVDGRSPLHFAADYGQLEVIEFLVGKVETADYLELLPAFVTIVFRLWGHRVTDHHVDQCFAAI